MRTEGVLPSLANKNSSERFRLFWRQTTAKIYGAKDMGQRKRITLARAWKHLAARSWPALIISKGLFMPGWLGL